MFSIIILQTRNNNTVSKGLQQQPKKTGKKKKKINISSYTFLGQSEKPRYLQWQRQSSGGLWGSNTKASSTSKSSCWGEEAHATSRCILNPWKEQLHKEVAEDALCHQSQWLENSLSWWTKMSPFRLSQFQELRGCCGVSWCHLSASHVAGVITCPTAVVKPYISFCCYNAGDRNAEISKILPLSKGQWNFIVSFWLTRRKQCMALKSSLSSIHNQLLCKMLAKAFQAGGTQDCCWSSYKIWGSWSSDSILGDEHTSSGQTHLILRVT